MKAFPITLHFHRRKQNETEVKVCGRKKYSYIFQPLTNILVYISKIIIEYFNVLCLTEYLSGPRHQKKHSIVKLCRIFLQFLQSNISG